MSWQPQNVVPGTVLHSWPVGHAPPQVGALLWAQVSTMSTQLHCVPVESVRQIWSAGHWPPHWGAGLCAHVVGGGLQKQPAAPGMQVVPVGQMPPHPGNGLWAHGTGTFRQLHVPVAAFDLQTEPVGQTPPQSGAGVWLQGTGMSWQPQYVLPGTGRHC